MTMAIEARALHGGGQRPPKVESKKSPVAETWRRHRHGYCRDSRVGDGPTAKITGVGVDASIMAGTWSSRRRAASPLPPSRLRAVFSERGSTRLVASGEVDEEMRRHNPSCVRAKPLEACPSQPPACDRSRRRVHQEDIELRCEIRHDAHLRLRDAAHCTRRTGPCGKR